MEESKCSFGPVQHIDNVLNQLPKTNHMCLLLWYIGPNGLKGDGVRFYQKLLQKFLPVQYIEKIILYDRTAWGALSNSDKKMTSVNPNVNIINSFKLDKIRALGSNNFFDWLMNLDLYTQLFVKEILKRKELYISNSECTNGSIQISDIFPLLLILEMIMDYDVAKIYPVFQYLEGLYLVYSMVKNNITNITFLLPNDEQKYYSEKYFEKDCIELLKLMQIGNNIVNNLSVTFVSFPYGSKTKSRPYNSGKEILEVISKKLLV